MISDKASQNFESVGLDSASLCVQHHVMLSRQSVRIRKCLARAEAARRKAEFAFDEQSRKDFATVEARWLRLAAGFEMVERIDRMLAGIKTAYPEHPVCPDCRTPMGLVKVATFAGGLGANRYECKACGKETTVPTVG
jgi:hypothetical protein